MDSLYQNTLNWINKNKSWQNNIKRNWSGPNIIFSHPSVSIVCKNSKYGNWRIDRSLPLIIPLINLWKLLERERRSVRNVLLDNLDASHLRFSSGELTVIFTKIWKILISCLQLLETSYHRKSQGWHWLTSLTGHFTQRYVQGFVFAMWSILTGAY